MNNINKCETFRPSKDVILRLCPDDPPFMVNRRTRDLIFLSRDLGVAIAILLKGGTLNDVARVLNIAGNEYKALIEALKYLVDQGWVDQIILSKLLD